MSVCVCVCVCVCVYFCVCMCVWVCVYVNNILTIMNSPISIIYKGANVDAINLVIVKGNGSL